jgi:hypothetical protein
MTGQIRAVALAVCRREGRILVERGHDRVRGEHYLRGIGGGVSTDYPRSSSVPPWSATARTARSPTWTA